MIIRSRLLVLLFVSTGFLAAGATDTTDVSFDTPVQIPEAVLQPGKYKIHLEDRLSDRAVVRVTEPNGTDHFLLTVPSKKLQASAKGLIFYTPSGGAKALHAWECSGCAKPLEFVYPKDEAVKLTASTGKPILAYDPSYDKLPADLSPEDRKVVTLWLLSPKTVTADGKGDGLRAAKYSAPRAMAATEPLPARMPKTSSSAFSQIAFGSVCFFLAIMLLFKRKITT